MNEVVTDIILPLPITVIVVVRMNEFFTTIVLLLPITIITIIIIGVRGNLIHPFLFILNPVFCGTFFFPYR